MTETRRRRGEAAVGPEWRVVPSTGAPVSPRRRGIRTAVAVDVGRLAATVSRKVGLGRGGMIGGRLALRVQPKVLSLLAEGKRIVVVTGTNGKTTTTRMVAEALRSRADAVSNATGANMLDGHVAALMERVRAPYAALEVDELHLARLAEQIEPSVIVLLNLSRDQLDRVGEIRTVEHSLRAALRRVPRTHVVANRDDPNIVSAAFDHPHVTWVSGGVRWKHDALNCPRCGAFLADASQDWVCVCGLFRPEADWIVTETGVVRPDGVDQRLDLTLPGRVNRINAVFALASAQALGCDRDAALRRIARIQHAAGRYGQVLIAGREARLLLAKNPASWVEMLDLVATHDRPLVLVVNSREADGHDVSWLWDIDFECLQGRTVQVSGDRALDLAVRLHYAGVHCEVRTTVPAALDAVAGGTPDVIANYTAFRDLFTKSVPQRVVGAP